MKNIISVFTNTFLLSVLILFLPGPVSAQQLAVIDGKVVAFDGKSNALWINETIVAPLYPTKALRKGLGGCVAIAYVINSDGSTSNHRILANNGTAVFNHSAIEAAKQFLYRPAEQNTELAPVIVSNTFTYQINPSNKTLKEKRKELSDKCSEAAKTALEPLTEGDETD